MLNVHLPRSVPPDLIESLPEFEFPAQTDVEGREHGLEDRLELGVLVEVDSNVAAAVEDEKPVGEGGEDLDDGRVHDGDLLGRVRRGGRVQLHQDDISCGLVERAVLKNGPKLGWFNRLSKSSYNEKESL